MNRRVPTSNPSTALRWILSLLLAAVIVPAVSLLWFVSHVLENEHLAIRQRLIASYTHKVLADCISPMLDADLARQAQLESLTQAKPNDISQYLMQATDPLCQGLVIYDPNGRQHYPVPSPPTYEPVFDHSWTQAWSLEFQKNDYTSACQAYAHIIEANTAERSHARMALARCLKKNGDLAEAAAFYQDLAQTRDGNDNTISDEQCARARVVLLQLYRSLGHPDYPTLAQKLLDDHFEDLTLDTASEIILLQRILDSVQQAEEQISAPNDIARTQAYVHSLEVSLTAHDTLQHLGQLPEQSGYQQLSPTSLLYARLPRQNDQAILALVSQQKLAEFGQTCINKLDDPMISARLLDQEDQLLAGPNTLPVQDPFLRQALDPVLPEFHLEVYFRDGVFTGAAQRKKALYMGVALSIIASMLVIFMLASRSIMRQSRLHKLKNDFIATITHELKTPLASCRLLVDTLIHERYHNQAQAREYLGLIAKENQRLSHLIDNFLTFSRMERNKQVFVFAPTDPIQLARDAAAAMQTKFNGKVQFKMDLAPTLPTLQADHDALVTVIINLLDNAYKYTGADKQITLAMQAESNAIRFSVSDNGMGMTRRQSKRVFDRFYQIDTRLIRQVEGAGLGLSIVKFIVDAHSGTITVTSQPERGSCFTVILPLQRN